MTGILERGEPVLCTRSTPGHPPVNFLCVCSVTRTGVLKVDFA